MHLHPPRRRDYSLPRRWQPLTNADWDTPLPFVLVRDRHSRSSRDARRHMDAIFWIAASGSAWHTVPRRFGKPDTVGRHFRRLSHLGLWERLLRALARPDAPEALLALEHWIVRACRRATRIRGLRIVVLARRLLFRSALRGPAFMLPDPDLSEYVQRLLRPVLERIRKGGLRAARPPHPDFFGDCAKLFGTAGGRRRIPRCLEPV